MFLLHLSENLTTQDIDEIRFLLAENISIPNEETGGAKGFMKSLEHKGLLSRQDLSFLRKLLRTVDRNDLVVSLDKQCVNINGKKLISCRDALPSVRTKTKS